MSESSSPEPVLASLGTTSRWEMVYEGELATDLRYELYREASNGHRLHGRLATALARCPVCGLVAYHLGDGSWALVELTMSGRPEPLPLPRHTRLESFDTLREMMARHRHWDPADEG